MSTAPEDRFVLIYYGRIAKDPKFDGIRDDDRLMGLWQRLLCLADAVWPADAPVPAGISKTQLERLSAPGIVEMHGKTAYRIHGLDAERQRRAERGKRAAEGRWHPDDPAAGVPTPIAPAPTNPPARAMREQCPSNADAMQAHPAPRIAKVEGGEGRVEIEGGEAPQPPVLGIEPALVAYSRFYPTPTRNGLKFLDELIAEYGQEATARAIGEAGIEGRTNLLSRAKGVLALWERNREQAERIDEQRRLTEKRSHARPPIRTVTDDLTPEQIEAEAEAYKAARRATA